MQQEPDIVNYGVLSLSHLKAQARRVVGVLGGGMSAYQLLVETAAAETLCGSYPDKHPDKWGVGVCQCDEIALLDVQQHLKSHHDEKIKTQFSFCVADVRIEDLADDPVKALVIARLHYKRVPEPIPSDLVGRAEYWKAEYNTRAGAGTAGEYLERVRITLGESWAVDNDSDH